MKHGFTLLELLIVIIIVAILATLGLTQYTAVIERSRGAEARQILGQLRSMCAGFYMQDGNTGNCTNSNLNINTTADSIPGPVGQVVAPTAASCRNSHYFSYGIAASGVNSGQASFEALRCTGAGKNPNLPAGTTRRVRLTTTYNTGGQDTWINPNGY